MDTLYHYRQIIRTVLQPYTKITYANVEVCNLAAFDTETDQYVIPSEGWDHHQHHHGCLIHIEIRDSTGDGTATELTNAGISKDAIGLGFQELRQTSYRFRCSLNRRSQRLFIRLPLKSAIGSATTALPGHFLSKNYKLIHSCNRTLRGL